MSERAAYSRVYWSIVDDPKFVTIYDSDSHLAAWLRLLLIADQAHPASGHLPSNVRRSSVRALADCGLLDLAGSRYRIHGLDAERERRKQAATSRPPKGPTTDPDGDHSGTGRTPTGIQTQGLRRDETSLDEGSRDEPTHAHDPWEAPETEALAWLSKHGCDVRPGNGYHQKLVLAVEQHGVNAVVGMFGRLAEAGVRDGDIKGLLFGTIDALNAQTRPSLREVAASERVEERQSDFKRRLERTKRETAELREAWKASE